MIIIHSIDDKQSEAKIAQLLKKAGYDSQCIELSNKKQYRINDLLLDGCTCSVIKNNHNISLTKKEYDLLLTLVINKNCALTKEELFTIVWGENSLNNMKVVCNTISKIRGKLGKNNQGKDYIQMNQNGYMICE